MTLYYNLGFSVKIFVVCLWVFPAYATIQSEHYGWEVLAISLDGKKLEEFPNAQPDNGLFEQWQQGEKGQVIPALYAVNPNTGHVIPIAFGMTSIDQMETRIMGIVHKGAN